MVEYIPYYSALAVHWGLLPATRLASRKIVIEQNIKGGQGQHSLYLAPWGTPVECYWAEPKAPCCPHRNPAKFIQ